MKNMEAVLRLAIIGYLGEDIVNGAEIQNLEDLRNLVASTDPGNLILWKERQRALLDAIDDHQARIALGC